MTQKKAETPQFLKSTRNGRVFQYTETLMKRGDMVLCDASGKPLQGQVSIDINPATLARKSKFLGIQSSGRLFPWNQILAARSDAVPVDDPDEWYAAQGIEAPAAVSKTVTDDMPDDMKEAVKVSAKNLANTIDEDVTYSIMLPTIEGMGKRDAKNVLAEWALERFGETLNRGQTLEELLDTCQGLITTAAEHATSTGTEG